MTDRSELKRLVGVFGSKTGQSVALSGLSLNAHASGATDKGSELGKRADAAHKEAEETYGLIMRMIDEMDKS